MDKASKVFIKLSEAPKKRNRKNMPQIKAKDAKQLKKGRRQAGSLTPSQKDFDQSKINRMARAMRKDGKEAIKPIIISKDNSILDGHHRWKAFIKAFGKNSTIPVRIKKKGGEEAIQEFKKKSAFEDIKPGKAFKLLDLFAPILRTPAGRKWLKGLGAGGAASIGVGTAATLETNEPKLANMKFIDKIAENNLTKDDIKSIASSGLLAGGLYGLFNYKKFPREFAIGAVPGALFGSVFLESNEKKAEAKSKSQQRLMGMAYVYRKGELDTSNMNESLVKKVKEVANNMSMKKLKEYAETNHKKGMPEKTAGAKLAQRGLSAKILGDIYQTLSGKRIRQDLSFLKHDLKNAKKYRQKARKSSDPYYREKIRELGLDSINRAKQRKRDVKKEIGLTAGGWGALGLGGLGGYGAAKLITNEKKANLVLTKLKDKNRDSGKMWFIPPSTDKYRNLDKMWYPTRC